MRSPTSSQSHRRAASDTMQLLSGLSMLFGREPFIDAAIRATAVARGEVVVDIGCGPGVAVRAAARLGARAVGIDPSPVMLRLAEATTRRRPDVHFQIGSAADTGLVTESASVLWALASAHHWPDLDAGLHEADRVLQIGGRLAIVERLATGRGLHGRHGFTVEQADHVASSMHALGFRDARVDRYSGGRHDLVVVRGVRA